jgi:hypothetical protein
MILIIIVLFIEAYKSYYKKQIEQGNTELTARRQFLIDIQLILEVISVILVVIGFLMYLGQKSREYPKWSWYKFWVGVEKCSATSLSKRLQRGMLTDLLDGLKRLVKPK